MLISPGRSLKSFAALIAGSLAFAPSALAAGPATVTVRVEGPNTETLLAQTQVTTTTTPIGVESGFCSGTSAGGALYDATHGDWTVRNEPEGVEIDGIEGLNFPDLKENPGIYWAWWLNGEYASHGACGEELANGADVVFVAQCYAVGPHCPSASAPDHFLTATSPTSTVVNVGEPVSVTVGSVSTGTGAPEASLPEGVTVTAGPVGVSPGAGGVATLTFSNAGTYVLQAHAPDSVPSDARTVCVHNGSDGNCGTTATGSTVTSASGTSGSGAALPAAPYRGPFALVPRVTGLIDGHVYAHGRAPRVLAGTVLAHDAVSSVSLELRRRHGGRCSAYDGTRERFVSARCGVGRAFQVSTGGAFSYLLPFSLAPGRYVLDIQASDAAGNHVTPARGTSRLVFYVR